MYDNPNFNTLTPITQIVSMKQITIPTGWDNDQLVDMYHFSYDKGRRVKDACQRLAMEISQDARVEHVGVFLLQRKSKLPNDISDSSAPADKLELASMTTNEPFLFKMKVAVDSSQDWALWRISSYQEMISRWAAVLKMLLSLVPQPWDLPLILK